MILLAIEVSARILGRTKAYQETRVERRAARGYWTARALRRKGRIDEGLLTVKAAYASLQDVDREATFAVMTMLIVLLDELAIEASAGEKSRDELVDALRVVKKIHADPSRRSAGLDQLLAWLEYRVQQSSPGI